MVIDVIWRQLCVSIICVSMICESDLVVLSCARVRRVSRGSI